MKTYLHTLISILTTVMLVFATENMDAASRRPNQTSGGSERENVTTTTRGRRPQSSVSTTRSDRQTAVKTTNGRRPSRPTISGSSNSSSNRKPGIDTSTKNVNFGNSSNLQGKGRRPISSGIQSVKDTDRPLGYRPHRDDDDDDDDDRRPNSGYRPHYDDDDDDDDDRRPHSGYRPHRDDDDWDDDDYRRKHHHGHGGYYPGSYNPGGYKPHSGGHWRPIAPPRRPYRPIPHYHYCPTFPVHYVPYYKAPVLDVILGLRFGLSVRVSLDNLYYGGYHLDGYDNEKVYLRNVKYLGVHWDDVIVYYDRYDRMNNISFYDSSSGYSTRRYNKLYRKLCREYGRPAVSHNYGNEFEVSWWDRYGEHFVTLSFGSKNSFGGPSRYYTTLTIGVR